MRVRPGPLVCSALVVLFALSCERAAGQPPALMEASAPVLPALVSSELALDSALGPWPLSYVRPAVAYGGSQYLVVWADRRSGNQWDIYGARISRTGEVLDPAAIPISTASADQVHPAVASDGFGFLVTWEDGDPTPLSTALDIRGARVDAEGRVLDVPSLPISLAASRQGEPQVAFDGKQYLVVWEDYRTDNTGDIWAVRVDTDGGVTSSTGFVIVQGGNSQVNPGIGIADGGIALVAFHTNANFVWQVYASRVFPTGTISAPFRLSSAANAGVHPAVGVQGATFTALWAEPDAGLDLHAARVNTGGFILLPDAGYPLEAAPSDQLLPAVTTLSGGELLVVWEDRRADAGDIYGTRVSATGATVGGEQPLTEGSNDETTPAVAFDGVSRSLVVYCSRDTQVPDAGGTVRARFVARPCQAANECGSGICIDGVCCATPCDVGTCATGVCEVPGAGSPDAGPGGGEPDSGESTHLAVGCGCSASGMAVALLPCGVLALARRRRPRA